MDILTASPPVSAWRHQPMTIADLDAHPDAGRIWATIKAMQEFVARAVGDAKQVAADRIEEEREQAADEAIDECRDNLERAVLRLLKKHKGKISNELAEAIENLSEEIE